MRIDINFNKTTQNKTHISKFLLPTYIVLPSILCVLSEQIFLIFSMHALENRLINFVFLKLIKVINIKMEQVTRKMHFLFIIALIINRILMDD